MLHLKHCVCMYRNTLLCVLLIDIFTIQGEDSTAGSINTMSICKSELLFSPVKETSTVPGHFSVDSLDCDRLEQDLILTCQANKHNYTIAFEGSITMYSEDSDCQDVSNGLLNFFHNHNLCFKIT